MHEPPSIYQRVLLRRRPPGSVARRPGIRWPAADRRRNHHHGHATAVRRTFEGIALARLSAGAQAVSPLADLASEHPLVLLPLEDGIALKTSAGHQIVAAGHLLLLPRKGDWS